MPNYYNPYPQYYPQMYPTQSVAPAVQPTPVTPTIQNSGFVSVRNEAEARNYPVAQGNSVTFKDETAPYVYTKTVGFSQLDRPTFEKYKLVKEDVEETEITENQSLVSELKDNIHRLWGEVDALKATVAQPATTTTRRKKDGDVRHDEQSE